MVDAATLSNAELADYRRDGFLVPRYRLDDLMLDELQALAQKIVSENPQLLDQPMAWWLVPLIQVAPDLVV